MQAYINHFISGAREAGWHAIWLDRRREGPGKQHDSQRADGTADITVDSEEELAEAVLGLLKTDCQAQT